MLIGFEIQIPLISEQHMFDKLKVHQSSSLQLVCEKNDEPRRRKKGKQVHVPTTTFESYTKIEHFSLK